MMGRFACRLVCSEASLSALLFDYIPHLSGAKAVFFYCPSLDFLADALRIKHSCHRVLSNYTDP